MYLLQSYRLGVFEANLKKSEEHNKEHAEGKHTWTMGVNQLADLTHEEFMIRNQLKVPEHSQEKTKYVQMQTKARPDSIDWRDRVSITMNYNS